MNPSHNHAVVIGAGVCGLTVAEALAGLGLRVALIEKTPFLGGYAAQLNCKATDTCVKCGACVAEDRLNRAARHPGIDCYTGAAVESVTGTSPYRLAYRVHSPLVNADRCNGCGICLPICPVPGAILQGRAPRVGPYVAIRRDLCRFFDNAACTLCRDVCPQEAIRLADDAHTGVLAADVIVAAVGFAPYNPSAKPYGYGLFPEVITSLDAERRLREDGVLRRPSDGRPVERVAVIQCVGSRDAALGHDWCSKICCGSSLRMARLIQHRQRGAQITFFYIDVQTFGKDFPVVYPAIREGLTMIRAIPGEIRRTGGADLEVIYFDPVARQSTETLVDLVILSVGLLPAADSQRLARMLGVTVRASGFLSSHAGAPDGWPAGVFTAGAALGPMSIAESIASAEKTAFDVMRYLQIT